MKYALFILLVTSAFVSHGLAQERIYRCGNEYTNTLPNGQSKGCKLIEGANVTVVKGTRPAGAAPAHAGSAAQRVDAGEQKSRDSDARLILESELKKSEARQLELQKEFNQGAPEKRGDEARNQQKYLDRVADLKANLARNESDIAGIRREIGRLGVSAAAK